MGVPGFRALGCLLRSENFNIPSVILSAGAQGAQTVVRGGEVFGGFCYRNGACDATDGDSRVAYGQLC